MRIERVALLGGALVLSLAANLFLVSAYTGRFSLGRTPEPGPVGRGAIGARYRSLPPDETAAFRTAMQPARPALQASLQALRQAQAEVLAALATQPYDRGRMQAAFATLQQATATRQRLMQAALADALAELPARDRAFMAGEQR